ncbi:SDR family oxidoreductase [Hymenobacter setariae]|uniref:SDR family oxidoreductase n=1 Tax=Hymenobacter setariae TaxID=2594794 RepID=UPI001F211F84|nr:hypothetical protein [Hymenobacter setariae]
MLQAPAAMCLFQGPTLIYELVNPSYQQLFADRALLGKPLLEAHSELQDSTVWAPGRHDLLGIERGGPLRGAQLVGVQRTKFAVVGFHDALRKELGEEGIRVTMLELGATRTEFGANVADAMAQRWAQLDAMAGEDVAQALVYAFAQPARVLVEEILLRPVKQTAP